MATVKDLIDKLSLRLISGERGVNKEVNNCYIGDLLSWVMSKAHSGSAWITVMGNVNSIAVATLVEIPCIILTENATLDADAKVKSNAKQIPVLSTQKSSYEIALEISAILNE